jgi:hypothetical protein
MSAQCRSFAKNSCESKLDDYMVNGRMYGGYQTQGQETELFLVLIGGQKYRLINCAKQDLGNVWIQLTDSRGHIVFDNSEHDYITNWDFVVKSTQEFKVRTFIQNPAGRSTQKIRDCSILILGSKSST